MSVYLSAYLFVCMLPMAGRMAGPIKTKLGIGTHVDPRSRSRSFGATWWML